MINTMVILNPNAGRLTQKNRLAFYYKLLNQYEQINAHFFLTNKKAEADEIIKHYHTRFDLIIAIGGDGTLNRVITGLISINRHIPIGYIPTGTTNDFAKTHRLLVSQKKALDIIINSTEQKIDIGQFNQMYFSYVAAFGAYTSVAVKTNQKLKNLLGYYAYILTSFFHLNTLKRYSIQLTIDGTTTHEDVIFFAVSNALSIGGLLHFSYDQVSLDDGYLDMCFIRFPKNGAEAFSIIRALKKEQYDHPKIVLKQVTSLKVESKTPLSWSIDGEDGGDLKDVFIQCLPQMISIIKPKVD